MGGGRRPPPPPCGGGGLGGCWGFVFLGLGWGEVFRHEGGGGSMGGYMGRICVWQGGRLSAKGGKKAKTLESSGGRTQWA